ncbi:MAG: PEGA domain-containing protein [Acidobacteria bacterium]|nr:PEGA domain-containing protein [Acidobacteriota bacterium]
MTPGTSYSPPSAFGRFRLLHQIGAGVLGPVFRTHDEQEQRLVAVKAFTLDITPERAEELSNQLQQVVDIDLEHPHIARPIATGVEDSVAYLAQQYVTGESLDAAIRQYGPAPAGDVVRLIGHVAEALDVAARVGVFHGALHPRDILVTPGETHITGLGVSMALERIGQHGPIRRPYAAPERESGLEWGAAADVFSLAVIAYEVLTGRRALPGTEQPLPGLSDLQVQDAAALREILEAAIDPDPERRPAKARDFVSALAATLVDAGAAHAPGERGSGSRRKMKSRAAKLPGLDDPLIPEEAAAAAAAPSTPVGGSEPAPADDASPESGANLVAPVAPFETHDVEQEPPPAAPLEPDLLAPDPAVPLAAEPFEVPELRMRPTPHPEEMVWAALSPAGVPPRAEPHESEAAALSSLFAPEPAEPLSAPPRTTGPDSFVDDARDAEPLRFDLSVPRAIDPTRGAESFSRPSRRFEPDQASRKDRSYAPIAIAAAAGLLLGLLGGYEIGARWGQSTPATATQPAPAGEPAARPAAAAPVTPPASGPAQTAVSSPVREQAAAAPPAVVGPGAEAPKTSGGEAPAKATTPPVVTQGRVNVRTVPPGADVSLDGERAGTSPRMLRRLPLGMHVVRVALSGYVAQERKVTITAARPAVRVDVTLRKAAGKEPASAPAISFSSRPPGARVILDGKNMGLTPFTLNRVAPGRHTIELRLAGFRPWTSSITVDAGKPQRVTASLERAISR